MRASSSSSPVLHGHVVERRQSDARPHHVLDGRPLPREGVDERGAGRDEGRLEKVGVYVQGDHSSCDKPHIDTKTNVAFYCKLLILKRNFCFDVNGRFVTT